MYGVKTTRENDANLHKSPLLNQANTFVLQVKGQGAEKIHLR